MEEEPSVTVCPRPNSAHFCNPHPSGIEGTRNWRHRPFIAFSGRCAPVDAGQTRATPRTWNLGDGPSSPTDTQPHILLFKWVSSSFTPINSHGLVQRYRSSWFPSSSCTWPSLKLLSLANWFGFSIQWHVYSTSIGLQRMAEGFGGGRILATVRFISMGIASERGHHHA